MVDPEALPDGETPSLRPSLRRAAPLLGRRARVRAGASGGTIANRPEVSLQASENTHSRLRRPPTAPGLRDEGPARETGP